MAGQFQSETTANLAAIRARVDEAETTLVRLSRDVRPAAMQIALGKGSPEDEQTVRRHREVGAEVATLRLALEAAEAAEIERRNSRIVADDAARRKAVAAHVARALSAFEKSGSAIQAAVAAYQDALNAVDSAIAASPSDIKAAGFLQHAFSPIRLGRLWLCEVARHAELRGIENALFRNAPYVADMRDQFGQLRPMRTFLAAGLDRLKADLRTGAARVAERYSAAEQPSPAATAGVRDGTCPAPAVEAPPERRPSTEPSKAKDAA